MAFSSSITSGTKIFGSMQIAWGTFTNTAGSTGGNIDTGLSSVESIFLNHSGASAVASAPSVNETLPASGSAITIVTTADADGTWMAIGKKS